MFQLHASKVTKLVTYLDRDRAFADLSLKPEKGSENSIEGWGSREGPSTPRSMELRELGFPRVAVEADIRDAREATVLEHIDAERRGDFDAALATFASPRYELPGDEVIDGAEAVTDYYRDLATGLPDLSFPEVGAGTLIHHSGDSVIVETRLMGTHMGSFRGLPPTGRRVDVPVIAIFDFEGRDSSVSAFTSIA